MKTIAPTQPTRAQEFFARLFTGLVRETFSWPGCVVHFGLMSFAGWSLRSPYWPVGILAGIAWAAAIFWLATLIAKRDERVAFGVLLFALFIGVIGFVSGFSSR